MMSRAGASQRPPWWAYGCLAASMALVGSYVSLSKALVTVIPIFLLAGLRFAIAAVAMTTWVRAEPTDVRLSAHDRRLLFLESFVGNFLFSICMLYGISMSSALTAGVIMSGIPAAVALLSRVFLGERIAARVGWGIAFEVGGIALVSMSRANPGAHPDSILGATLLLGALLCEAGYVVIGKKLTAQVSPRRISALINLWGLVLVIPLALWQARTFDFGSVAPSIWWLLVFYALAASVVTVWLWMTGLRHVPASSAGVFTVMLPLSAATVGVTVLGEQFSPAQAGAFALALLGLALATWPGRSRARPIDPAP